MRDFVRVRGVSSAVEELFSRHLEEYKGYWGRMTLQVGEIVGSSPTMTQSFPTMTGCCESTVSELLAHADRSNTALINLYTAFCRYLQIIPTRRAVLISLFERHPIKRMMMCGIPK